MRSSRRRPSLSFDSLSSLSSKRSGSVSSRGEHALPLGRLESSAASRSLCLVVLRVRLSSRSNRKSALGSNLLSNILDTCGGVRSESLVCVVQRLLAATDPLHCVVRFRAVPATGCVSVLAGLGDRPFSSSDPGCVSRNSNEARVVSWTTCRAASTRATGGPVAGPDLWRSIITAAAVILELRHVATARVVHGRGTAARGPRARES